MVIIPVEPGTASLLERVTLDEKIFILRLVWNARAASWFLSVSDNEDNPLVLGMPLRADAPINRHARYNPDAPQGVFYVFDSTDKGIDPTFDDLGVRVALGYLSKDEIDAAVEAA